MVIAQMPLESDCLELDRSGFPNGFVDERNRMILIALMFMPRKWPGRLWGRKRTGN